MLLFLLSYLGGALTILSPCILPVLPFVFARADRPFLRSGLPLLAGMALTFALVASAAAIGGGWVVAANQAGRGVALALMALFGLTLLLPGLAERLARPLVAIGSRLSEVVARQDGRPGAALLLGVATGLLWAPCAGPILGLLLTGAALRGASVGTALLLLAYGAGAATSLALALLVGGRVLAVMKRSLGVGEGVRRGLGAAMLVGVAAIALGLDTGLLARLSTASTAELEQRLVERVLPAAAGPSSSGVAEAEPDALPDEGPAPDVAGAVQWLNSPPLTLAALKGKVVLVDFWTYSCINCLRSLPYVAAWADKYRAQGLVVIGVHAPEFAFERDPVNVARAVRQLGLNYPVALDNEYAIWRAFSNRYWPAHYFIDARGRLRHHHFGEGEYDRSERVIQALLREAGATGLPAEAVELHPTGLQQAAAPDPQRSPETYLGTARAARFLSRPAAREGATRYRVPADVPLDGWGLEGNWTIGPEQARAESAGTRLLYRFHARDLHLVLGPGADGRPVRFRVTLDGQPPGAAHGGDAAADGRGIITEQRLYHLIRHPGPVADHTFAIEFLDPGVTAYAFTFG